MANIKSNIKNIRKTARRSARNKHDITASRSKIKQARNTPNTTNLAAAYKKIDSIASKRKIHKNKANRLKSRLAKANNRVAKTAVK
ncbi:MAG: 30S ribosomal protein S20 [Mycoplasmataceae bacterium]|jgi:small subunit ribosomal protein S20|nr:30S ribosomal protein S20 [Mycoplasmataceae bacterium]